MIMADMAFDLPLVCAGALLGVAACIPLCWAVMRAWKPRPTANIGVGIACVTLSFLVLVAGVAWVYADAPGGVVPFVVGELVGFFCCMMVLVAVAMRRR